MKLNGDNNEKNKINAIGNYITYTLCECTYI